MFTTLNINEEQRARIAPLFSMEAPPGHYITVSEMKTLITDKFDSENVAADLERKNFNNPDSKYYNMTKDQILESWARKASEAVSYGKMLDSVAEAVLETRDELAYEELLLDNSYDADYKCADIVDAFNEFISKCAAAGIEYVGREIPVCYKPEGCEMYMKGRIDCLLYNKKTNKYIIIDWKTDDNIELSPNKWSKQCLGAARDYMQMSFHTYSLQVYSYKAALLQTVLKGVNPDDITCCICNCPKTGNSGKRARVYTAYGVYDKQLLDKIYCFCAKKKAIMLKRNN